MVEGGHIPRPDRLRGGHPFRHHYLPVAEQTYPAHGEPAKESPESGSVRGKNTLAGSGQAGSRKRGGTHRRRTLCKYACIPLKARHRYIYEAL